MNSTIRIVAAVLDTHKLTLYMQDGLTTVLHQGDPRIRRIIDQAAPQISAHNFADIDLSFESKEIINTYANFEEASTKVRFFRIAKEKLKGLFSRVLAPEPEPNPILKPMTFGAIPQSVPVQQNVIDEIMTHAVKVTDPAFSEAGLDRQAPIKDQVTNQTPNQHTPSDSPDTIIAVTDSGQIIPGMERIKTQFGRAAKESSTIGMERFLERIGSVIAERRHSVEDLLKFLERGDLPIAEDGCILIYKVLNHRGFAQHPLAKYADVHSSNVPQWVGARVMMKPELVDPNRSQECSNGLHVARRGYVGNFHGSVCVLAKLAPEDVIAVPRHDANKMRVCGYNIIFELSSAQFDLLKSHRPLTDDPAGKNLLARALAGNHTPVTHEVEITASHGGGIVVRDLSQRVLEPVKKKLEPAEAMSDEVVEEAAPVVDPKDVIPVVQTMVSLSAKGKATALVNGINSTTDPGEQAAFWLSLLQVKKTSRYSWERLGVPDDLVTRMFGEKKSPEPEESLESPESPESPELAPEPVSVITEAEAEARAESYSQRINRLALITPMTKQTAASILNLKKQSKKSWTTLKVPEKIVAQVVELTTAK